MKELVTAIRLFIVLSILTGVIYPLAVTGIAQGLFQSKANGSPMMVEGKVVGSKLVGQQFDDPKYFWGRPSTTSPIPYNAAASSGSNLGPTNPALIGGKDKDGKEVSGSIKDRVAMLHAADPSNVNPIPTDLATSSASGLDPNISVEAAEYQIPRVARERHLSVSDVEKLVRQSTSPRQLGIFGEPVVNVLSLNLELDRIQR